MILLRFLILRTDCASIFLCVCVCVCVFVNPTTCCFVGSGHPPAGFRATHPPAQEQSNAAAHTPDLMSRSNHPNKREGTSVNRQSLRTEVKHTFCC